MTWDQVLQRLSIPVWLLCLLCLSPAVYRLLRRRARYLDPVWALVFLLSLNRLSFLLHVSPEFSHLSALVLAIAMAHFTRWYQRRDQ